MYMYNKHIDYQPHYQFPVQRMKDIISINYNALSLTKGSINLTVPFNMKYRNTFLKATNDTDTTHQDM